MEELHRASLGRRDSFVVRIWQEKDEPKWKGWVQHVHTGESAFFQSPEELLAFFECWTGRLGDTDQRGLK